MRQLPALALLFLAASIGTARAATITFEDQGFAAPPNAQPHTGDLANAGGFFFDMAGPTPVYQLANNSADVDNGTTYLVIEGTPSQVTFSPVGGGAFALTSFDYAEWQNAGTAHQISVIGNRVGGGTVTATPLVLNLDLIFDGPGGATDFQKASFDAAWTNLSSVVLLGTGATFGNLNYFAIDNIVVSPAAVPEPGFLTLLGVGSAFLVGRRRRLAR